MKTHILGFPRIGFKRETKQAVEAFWRGELDEAGLQEQGQQIRLANWQRQRQAGIDMVTVGDFSWYDHVLDTSVMLGVIPARFASDANHSVLDTTFRMARGRGQGGSCCQQDTFACEMTKWFDTNYHYIVPELVADQGFELNTDALLAQLKEAQAAGFKAKPVVLGPLSYLRLAKCKGTAFDVLDLLEQLVPVYQQLLHQLAGQGVEWVQIDEPALVLDLPNAWKRAYERTYNQLNNTGLKLLLTTYFGGLEDNLHLAVNLPVAGLHVDLVRAPEQLGLILDQLAPYKILSLGLVDGRNIWRNDLQRSLAVIDTARKRLGDRLWLASSCSLLHVPVDLAGEQLPDEVQESLAFAQQKLEELSTLKNAALGQPDEVLLTRNREVIERRKTSSLVNRAAVKQRLEGLTAEMAQREKPYAARAVEQQQRFRLPLFPTTTIGSFPQTTEIRRLRGRLKRGEISAETYELSIKNEISGVINAQERYGLDVLVHGEPERNDMVEYFGEQLEGFAFTANGWVQSYGSRCVKPPIIYGDVARPQAMTVAWSEYAQSLTDKPVKGMLTGPVTILQWSFVRDDQPRRQTCQQIALALRDEVEELEAAGIGIIQIDEPALREGLPLRQQAWQGYLDWAVEAFRLTASVASSQTQIHTHMCYAEFNDIIASIAALDADVITIETSRSDMELLEAFADFDYPNEIGPGVYDIHSPRVPKVEEMVALMLKAAEGVDASRLWVNPDCGLKTRGWPETEEALELMVEAAGQLRSRFGSYQQSA